MAKYDNLVSCDCLESDIYLQILTRCRCIDICVYKGGKREKEFDFLTFTFLLIFVSISASNIRLNFGYVMKTELSSEVYAIL